MKIELNHTIIQCRNKLESANFVAEILGLPPPKAFFHFLVLQTTNHASLDFLETEEQVTIQHYAFLVGEAEFDAIFARIQKKKVPYWADPRKQQPGEINQYFGGRGFYFEEPSGHYLEVITKPYDLAAK
jgi:extradiol dioxygenase family protein